MKMLHGIISNRFFIPCMLVLFPGVVAAEGKYTYIKASLGYPWLMFFIFLALISIPFLLIVGISWRNYRKSSNLHSAGRES